MQQQTFDMRLVGEPLPGCQHPLSCSTAVRLARAAPLNRPCSIWHVRRVAEMRTALWARDLLRLPIRIVFTSAAQRRRSALPRWLMSRMDAVIATTDRAVEFAPHVRAVIPQGVDTEQFLPATNREAAWNMLGYPGARGVATVGQIRPETGTDLFVDTMLRVLPGRPDVTALVIGKASRSDAGFLADLKRRVEAAGMAERILFPGEVTPDQMPGLLRGLSILVALPRCVGYGMTALEAMASGVPLVASKTGPFSEFSAQEVAAKLVTLEDIDAAVTGVDALLGDADLLRVVSDRAVKTVLEGFGIEREAADIAQVYDAVWEKL